VVERSPTARFSQSYAGQSTRSTSRQGRAFFTAVAGGPYRDMISDSLSRRSVVDGHETIDGRSHPDRFTNDYGTAPDGTKYSTVTDRFHNEQSC